MSKRYPEFALLQGGALQLASARLRSEKKQENT
jgi:hypothetical protein